ncbi:imidazolonepropionase [Rhodanobacter sp. DHB23]|uniref:imidazolonepropionase n=1 Tax=Rhodanobacter sp. DHB23 TaxID=2775923 RepID=UPI00177FEF17|nr:imidazolonepropionase [Rhodanobacter sp. DHB23]MBD8871866.1 imidazolonepropionase [Rhodanobacter sp. DHB23]
MMAPRWDLLLTHANLAGVAGDAPFGSIEDGAVACADGRIAWVGAMCDLPPGAEAMRIEDLGGALLTPGLVDCHTHLVFGGHRANEFDMRLNGASYEDVARAGGGIVSSVRATRAASEDELFAQSLPRARALLADGVTTLEIKSGYGLDLETERRMLRVARRIGESLGITVRTSFLGLHALPPEYRERRDDYVALVCDTMLPALAAEGLVDAVDAFCEKIAFTPAETRRLFERATRLGLPVKLHAEQLSDQGGAALVAAFDGLSADHLEHLGEAGIAAMAKAGTVAVLLPGAFYALRETQLPPVAALRGHGVPIAIATDCNPGTSPLLSLRLAANMACTLFRLTPEEALRGVTAHAARALGLHDRGTLAVGQRADLVAWNAQQPAELCYWIGGPLVRQAWIGARPL